MSAWPTTPARVIARARKDIGLGESPAGSNHNRITVAYGEGNGAWCAMAVWYWFHGEGVDLRKEFTAGWAATTLAANAAKREHMWTAGHSGIRAGDIVFYHFADGDPGFVNHVGIVSSTPTPSTIKAIEGNTANVVAERLRARSLIVGYIRPPYQSGPKPPKPSPTVPLFPGRAKFAIGHSDPAVTELDKQLVRLGYTKHNDGNGYQPGPVFTKYTRDNVRDFQHAQGWTGDDADGYPGPDTWRLLFTTRARG